MPERFPKQNQYLKDKQGESRQDFTSEAVTKMWHNFELGMMLKYIEEKEYRDSKYPIVE